MKKLLLLTILCLSTLILHAQRCAVLDFQIGENVTAEEVEAVSYEFRSTFNPTCYTVEDYFKVKRIIKELGYNPKAMNKEQIRKFGRDMVVVVVVYGTLNKYMDEYSLDVNVLDVSTGATIVNDYSTFQKSEYRTQTRDVSSGISTKLCNSSFTSKSSNNSGRSNTSNRKTVQQGYTDLGLPSGTIWKNFNSTGLYSYDQAVSKFGNSLPTKEQWEELKKECQWTWTGNGFKVTGRNGEYITLPADGYRTCNGTVNDVNEYGRYWSSDSSNSENAYTTYFNKTDIFISTTRKCNARSVRLIQN